MRLLQRYILAELLRVFLFVLSVLTILLVFLGVVRETTANGLGALQIIQVLPYIIPSLLPYTIPATLLLSVCVVYGRMSGDQEVTAAKAAGISVLSLLAPSLFLGAVMSVCSLLLTDQVIPWAESNFQRIVTSAMKDILLDMLRTQHQITVGQYSISVHEVRDDKLIWPVFRYAPKGKRPVIARAQEAELIQFDFEQQQVLVRFSRTQVDVPNQGRQWMEEFEHPFPLQTGSQNPKARHINVQALQKKLQTLEEQQQQIRDRQQIEAAFALAIGDFESLAGPRIRQFDTQLRSNRHEFRGKRTEVHSRFALACSCFFFVFAGSPFAVLQARRQFLTNFFLCFLPILLIYYPVVLLTMNLSKSGSVDPLWAMWVGNVLVFVAGLFLVRRVIQH
jgi:lipopolysaccharide export system permease protein